MAYLGEEIRKLGFGLMRLPQKDGAICMCDIYCYNNYYIIIAKTAITCYN